MRKYRSRVQIMIDILKVIHKKGKARPTHILYGANLSHDRLKKYLRELEENGLIIKEALGGYVVYKLTSKGLRLLREYDKIRRFAEAFGIEL